MKIQEKELEVLHKLCAEQNLNTQGVYTIIKAAQKLSYENTTDRTRRKEYNDLIDFHLRRDK